MTHKKRAKPWKQVRRQGVVRFIINRGIVENRYWFLAYFVIGLAVFLWSGADLRHDWMFFALIFALFFPLLLLRPVANAYLEWREKEKDYFTKVEFKRGGRMLDIGDVKKPE